jgi:hypothetical protein
MQPLGSKAMRKILKKILEILDGTPAVYGKRERGQSLFELALVTPVLCIMLAGIVEIGWYAQNYLNLIEAAKVGARRGPFLNSENSPQEWPVLFSEAPTSANIGPSLSPYLIDKSLPLINQPDTVLNLIRDDPTSPHYLRYNYRNCNASEQFFGFFNLVACTVLDSIDPLTLKIGETCKTYWTGDDGNNDGVVGCLDDIVVSAFSVQKVKSGPAADDDIDLNAPPNGNPNGKNYNDGHQVVVVGRYPYDANECQGGGNNLDGRDPFDYIVNGESDVWYAPNPVDPSKDVRIELELIKSYTESSDGNVTVEFRDGGAEFQRGFVWTGQHRIENNLGIECYGSEWDTEDVERLMNLPEFINDGNQDRLSYLPSQGVVIVEIFWQHHLMLADPGPYADNAAFPIWSAAYGLFSQSPSSEVIHVWAAFPAPSAQPSIVYKID